MKTKNENKTKIIPFNFALLHHASKMIINGKPLTGMLMINEYLDASSPMRRGLISMAEDKILEHDFIISPALLEKILIKGAKLSNLSAKEKLALKILNERTRQEEAEEASKKAIIKPFEVNKKRIRERMIALKDAYLTGERFKKRRCFKIANLNSNDK